MECNPHLSQSLTVVSRGSRGARQRSVRSGRSVRAPPADQPAQLYSVYLDRCTGQLCTAFCTLPATTDPFILLTAETLQAPLPTLLPSLIPGDFSCSESGSDSDRSDIPPLPPSGARRRNSRQYQPHLPTPHPPRTQQLAARRPPAALSQLTAPAPAPAERRRRRRRRRSCRTVMARPPPPAAQRLTVTDQPAGRVTRRARRHVVRELTPSDGAPTVRCVASQREVHGFPRHDLAGQRDRIWASALHY